MNSAAHDSLRRLGACSEAIAWAEAHGGTLAEMWAACPRGDWLLWYAGRAGVKRADLVRAAAACTELALPYAGPTRGACEAAIAAARAWTDAPGPETADAATRAASAASAADAAARAADAAYAAANAAAYAASAAGAAAYAADAAGAADAANAAANAAYAAANAAYAAGAAHQEMHRRCADVVRGHLIFKGVEHAGQ